MKIDRRRALALAGAGLGAAGASACATAGGDALAGPGGQFLHGVASGDPTPAGAVLWTRVTADAPSGAVPVRWSVQDGGGAVVKSGRASAEPGRDHTVKVDVTGLKPGRDYTYRFETSGGGSPVGRFRTLPVRADDVVLAVASCSLHPGGLFNAYDAIAKLERVDAVLHLGDYIYEYGARPTDYGVGVGQRLNRLPQPPHEIRTLADYRLRHAQYKSDPDLQAAHARAAWITVWDDHETANDSWLGGAENHDPDQGEGDWAARKAAALKAYYEWMPIREPARGRSAAMIDRSFRFGDVATLHMVETRLTARGEPLSYETDLPMAGDKPDLAAFRRVLGDPGRQLLGETQLASLGRSVAESVRGGVAWQLLGNQIVMGRVRGPDLTKVAPPATIAALTAALEPGIRGRVERMVRLFVNDVPMNLDAWDGYPAERERLYAMLKAAGARPIALAGDSHAFWVNELKDSSGDRVGAEFGTTSVTSPGFGDAIRGFDLGAVIAAQNEEVVFSDQGAKGFTLLRLTKDEVVGELTAVSTILAKPYETRTLKRFRVAREGAGMSAPVAV